MISRRVTVCLCAFSISIPTAALPGIGASILMLLALMLSAISSERLVICPTFTPIAGSSSYLVTDGPVMTFVTLASTLKLARVLSRRAAFSFSVSFVSPVLPVDVTSGPLRMFSGGSLYLLRFCGVTLMSTSSSSVLDFAVATLAPPMTTCSAWSRIFSLGSTLNELLSVAGSSGPVMLSGSSKPSVCHPKIFLSGSCAIVSGSVPSRP